MTRSNRAINRVLLALVGILLLAIGGVLIVPGVGAVRAVGLSHLETPSRGELWIIATGALVVVILAVAWIVTRGRGRTSALIVRGDSGGSITVDARVAADLISDASSGDSDVIAVGSNCFRVRGRFVLSLRVVTRKGVDLPQLIRRTGETIEQLDVLLEQRIPILLQVVSGVRATLAHEVRAR